MTVTRITDHGDQALARLIEQYKGKPRIAAVVSADAAQVQALEDVLHAMLTNRAYANAEGDQLDAIGAIVGATRTPGDDDATYRLDIAAKIGQNVGHGTPEDVIDAALFVTSSTIVRLEDLYPAAVNLEIDGAVPNDDADAINTIMQGLLPAGVLLSAIVSADTDAAFCFEDGVGEGFGDFYDPAVGGLWGAIIGGLDESEEVPLATKFVDVAFTAESTKDVDVLVYGLNAQRCDVDVLDADDDYRTASIDVTRPDTSTIRLTSGSAITKNLRLLIVETEA